MTPRADGWLRLIVALAFAARLFYGLTLDPLAPYADRGSDTAWYLETGLTMVNGGDMSHLTPPPLYILVIGLWQKVLPGLGATVAIRFMQAALSALTVWIVYRITLRLYSRSRRIKDAEAIEGSLSAVIPAERAALIAAAWMAASPAFILESGAITTETLFMTLLLGGLAVYLIQALERKTPWAGLILAGVLLGLATLTRAVLLLFPLGLVGHWLFVHHFRGPLAWKGAATLLLAYSLTVSTWTIYSWAKYERFVIAGDGFAAFLYVGATGWDDPQVVDQRLAEATDGNPDENRQQNYTNAAADSISANPGGYLRRRVSELAGSILQPYGTTYFSGPSLRQLAADWWRGQPTSLRGLMNHWLWEPRSTAGLAALTREEAFWPKLTLYLFHYPALILGAVGMWLSRRQWRSSLVLIGYIVYTLLVHLILLALPRYIFPTVPLWIAFAAATIQRMTTRSGPDASEPDDENAFG